jgi:hypothetical protein
VTHREVPKGSDFRQAVLRSNQYDLAVGKKGRVKKVYTKKGWRWGVFTLFTHREITR